MTGPSQLLSPALKAAVGRALASAGGPIRQGTVRAVSGLAVEVEGLAGAVGDVCALRSTQGELPAEIVGFRDARSIVMPYGPLHGVRPGAGVESRGAPLEVPVGSALLGRIIDPLGRPLDDGPPIRARHATVTRSAPAALGRRPIDRVFATGVSALDGFCTVGRGQRLGIFAGSGVGKSTLLGGIARNGQADVNVVALIGERGREVAEFVDDVLGKDGLARSVVVVATADAAPMLRFVGAFTAVSIAEAFRDEGRDVLFTCDSITRFAAAAREIGLAAGEPPTLRGYPPSLFAALPRLVERLGNSAAGSITGLLTVLVEGDDLGEPVSDTLRGHLDGHVVLDRQIAARGRFPAVDILGSVSRLMPKLTTPEHQQAARAVRRMLAVHEEARDLVQVGAYKRGSDPELDAVLRAMPAIEVLLGQGPEPRAFDETLTALRSVAELSTSGRGPVDE